MWSYTAELKKIARRESCQGRSEFLLSQSPQDYFIQILTNHKLFRGTGAPEQQRRNDNRHRDQYACFADPHIL